MPCEGRETGRFDTRTQAVKLHKNFDHFKKSLQLKTVETFWVNILRSLNQVRETIYSSMGLTCIETALHRNDR